jgi:hypothetical protein
MTTLPTRSLLISIQKKVIIFPISVLVLGSKDGTSINDSVLDPVLFDPWVLWILDPTHISESIITIFGFKKILKLLNSLSVDSSVFSRI